MIKKHEQNETRRILSMVESGKLSAEEADRLLNEMNAAATVTCPWCAEEIPADCRICPECHTALSSSPPVPAAGTHERVPLGTLNGILLCYTFVVGVIEVISHLGAFTSPAGVVRALLGGLALFAAWLMWKRDLFGWTLGILWSAAQIVLIVLHGAVLNVQFFCFPFITTTNDNGVGLNFLAILLLVLFVVGRKQIEQRQHQE